ncbi:MAG: tetratricopeptide repeat protein [Acetobacteraceae bacterium]
MALKGGSPELALQIASTVLARNPGNEAALLTIGEALTALGRPDEAAVNFEKALAINSQSVGAFIGLGRLRLGTDPAGAEGLFLQALAREPRNGVALNNLGIARDLQGRHVEAQAAYRQALAVTPDMRAAQVNLALSLAMSGQSRDAVQLLRPLADAPGANQQMRHDLAVVLTMNGDRAEAERILSKDLPPNEVRQALDAYATGRPNAAAGLLNPGQPPPETPVALPVPGPIGGAVPGPVPTAPPAAASAARRTTVQVQLAGPTPSRDAAEVKWQRLRKEMPELLDAHEPVLAEVTQNGQPVWRVRTGGFGDQADASSFCQRVRVTGTSCSILP